MKTLSESFDEWGARWGSSTWQTRAAFAEGAAAMAEAAFARGNVLEALKSVAQLQVSNMNAQASTLWVDGPPLEAGHYVLQYEDGRCWTYAHLGVAPKFDPSAVKRHFRFYP